MSSAMRGCGDLVGRRDELDAIKRVTASGGPDARVIAVTGDPGIGKTRLLAELAGQARSQGLLVIGGAATEFERHLPFAALTESLGDWLRCGEPSAARFEPQVRALLDSLSVPSADNGHLLGLHREARAVFEELAAPHGLVVLLDDLHWADAALVGLIGYLIRRPPRGRWVLALGYRPRQVDHRVEEVVCSAEYVERIELGPLSVAESRQLLGAGVAPAAAESLHRDSGGNPLFLKALQRAGKSTPDRIADGSADLPPAVYAALMSELRGLTAAATAVARAAAVAGDPFQYDLVAAVADLEEGEAARLVDELVKRDVVRQVDPAPRFSFRHPLVRQVVYTAMTASARRDAHHRAAVALERDDATPMARAHHVARSARHGDQAASALLAEVAHATLFHAPDTAAWLLDESLRLLPGSQEYTTLRHHRTLGLARALILTGRLRDGREEAHTLLGRLPDDAAATRAEAAIVTATADRLLGRYAQGRAVLHAELNRLDRDAHPAAVSIMLELVTNGLLAGDFDPHRRDILDVVSAAERIGDRSLKATASAVLAFATYATGRYPEALVQLDVATQLVDALSPDELLRRLDVAVWLAWTELFVERYELAIDRFDRALTLMRVAGQGHLLTYAMVGKSQAYVQIGQLDKAVEWASNAVEAAELSASDELRTMAYTLLCLATTYGGDVDTALWAGGRAVAAAGPSTSWWAAGAGILLAQARLAAGAEPAQCLKEMLVTGGGPELCRVDVGNRPFMYQALAHAELARRDPAAALAWVDRMDAAVAGLGSNANGRTATAALLRAKILLHAGQPIASVESAKRAVHGFTLTRRRFFLGRAHLALGRALTASGQRADGMAQLRQAQTIFADLGAHRFLDESIQAQRQQGRRAVRETGSVDTLTKRETEVALLVAEGHTNRKIAQRLSLSERTVETHIRHICTRLDVSSRTAIAVAITRNGHSS